jgi:hypothetical protein
MGFDEKSWSVFRVTFSDTAKWEVRQEGFDKLLASFETQKDAREYARGQAHLKDGSTVKVFDERGNQMPAEGSARMPLSRSVFMYRALRQSEENVKKSTFGRIPRRNLS